MQSINYIDTHKPKNAEEEELAEKREREGWSCSANIYVQFLCSIGKSFKKLIEFTLRLEIGFTG